MKKSFLVVAVATLSLVACDQKSSVETVNDVDSTAAEVADSAAVVVDSAAAVVDSATDVAVDAANNANEAK